MHKHPEITAKTRKRLINAFWNLYKTERIEKISIGAIARKAGVNRGTFYEYFSDIYDLLDQFENDILSSLKNRFTANTEAVTIQGKVPVNEMISIFHEYGEEFYILLGNKGDPAFYTKLKNAMRSHIIEVFHVDPTKKTTEYFLTYILAALTGMIGQWYESDKDISDSELMELIFNLIYGGLSNTVDPEDLPFNL